MSKKAPFHPTPNLAAAVADIDDSHQEPYARLVLLLQEYTEKLQRFHEQATSPAGDSSRFRSQFKRMLPSARKLAQFASQRLTWGEDELSRLELELRLAEFEMALNAIVEL